MITGELVLHLMTILAAAWLFGYFFGRLGLPTMLGQMVAGFVLGPQLLGWITASPSLELMANMGIFFMMFYTGMDMDPKELLDHIRPVLATAVGGFVLPFVLGFLITRYFHGTVLQSLFMGMCVSITAIAIQSIVLEHMRINKSETGPYHHRRGHCRQHPGTHHPVHPVQFGANRLRVAPLAVTLILAKDVAFFGLVMFLGYFVMPRISVHVTDEAGFGFTFAIGLALAMGYLAHLAGLHIIIGAFFAGQIVRREMMNEVVYEANRRSVFTVFPTDFCCRFFS